MDSSDFQTELLKQIEELARSNALLRSQASHGATSTPGDIYYRCFDSSPIASILIDMESCIVLDASRAAIKLYNSDRATMLQTTLDMLEPSINVAAVREQEGGETRRVRHRTGDGKMLDVEVVCSRPVSFDRGLQYWNVFEIKAEAETIKNLKKSEQRYREMIEAAQDMVYRTDMRGFYTYANPYLLQTVGYTIEELRRTHYTALIRSDFRYTAQAFYTAQGVGKAANTYHEMPVLTKDGRELWIGQNVQTLLARGQVVGFQAIARIITERQQTETRISQYVTYLHRKIERLRARLNRLYSENSTLEDLALTDYLTGLNNRRAFQTQLGQEFEAARANGAFLSLLLIDLDHFKRVNDTAGHPAGDLVLQSLGEQLRSRLRQSDIVARFGGDEFAVILPGADRQSAVSQAERLRELVQQ